MNIKKSIAKVFSANFIQLVSNLIVGFFVPSILSIDGYANLKTYTLFVSYAGILHFGFIDGLFIKYGGKKYEQLDKGVLKFEHNFFIIFELLLSLIICLIGLLLKNKILFLFGITVFPLMVASFHKYLYQATGEFGKYSKIMYAYTLSYLLINIILVLFFKVDNFVYYCFVNFVANLLSGIFFEIKYIRDSRIIVSNNSPKIIKNNIKVGFIILLGNLAVMGLYGIDKWFIKLFFDNSNFAYYSFAVSMLHIVTTLVNAISITFYNYLFNNNNYNVLMKLQKYLSALGCFSSFAYFPLALIVNYFLNKYIPSLNLISITFSTFPYMIIINAIFINLYKVNKNEKHYFKVVISMLIISIVYNIIALLIFKTASSIAYATVATLVTWYIYSTFDIEKIKFNFSIFAYMILMTITFLILSHFKNCVFGGIIYLLLFVIFTYLFCGEIFKDLRKNISLFKQKINERRIKND